MPRVNEEGTHWQDEIPTLHDLGGKEGLPGRVYAYVSSPHVFEAQSHGWHRLPEAPDIKLDGPKGTVTFTVLDMDESDFTGRGFPEHLQPYLEAATRHLRAEASRRLLLVDEALWKETGLPKPPDPFEVYEGKSPAGEEPTEENTRPEPPKSPRGQGPSQPTKGA